MMVMYYFNFNHKQLKTRNTKPNFYANNSAETFNQSSEGNRKPDIFQISLSIIHEELIQGCINLDCKTLFVVHIYCVGNLIHLREYCFSVISGKFFLPPKNQGNGGGWGSHGCMAPHAGMPLCQGLVRRPLNRINPE